MQNLLKSEITLDQWRNKLAVLANESMLLANKNNKSQVKTLHLDELSL